MNIVHNIFQIWLEQEYGMIPWQMNNFYVGHMYYLNAIKYICSLQPFTLHISATFSSHYMLALLNFSIQFLPYKYRLLKTCFYNENI
jgi:hypothetical protein